MQFTPKVVFAIVFFIIGWVLGNILARAIEQIFNSLKIDSIFKTIGADDFFRKAGMNFNSGYFVGQVTKWFVVVVFLLPSLNLLGLDSIKDFLQNDVLGFLPKVIVAAFILIIAALVSEGLQKIVVSTAKTISLSSAQMLGAIAKYAVWVFAFIIALGYLGIAEYYMGVLFTGFVAMLSIGGALAFGLGGRNAAERFISKLSEEVSHK